MVELVLVLHAPLGVEPLGAVVGLCIHCRVSLPICSNTDTTIAINCPLATNTTSSFFIRPFDWQLSAKLLEGPYFLLSFPLSLSFSLAAELPSTLKFLVLMLLLVMEVVLLALSLVRRKSLPPTGSPIADRDGSRNGCRSQVAGGRDGISLSCCYLGKLATLLATGDTY